MNLIVIARELAFAAYGLVAGALLMLEWERQNWFIFWVELLVSVFFVAGMTFLGCYRAKCVMAVRRISGARIR